VINCFERNTYFDDETNKGKIHKLNFANMILQFFLFFDDLYKGKRIKQLIDLKEKKVSAL